MNSESETSKTLKAFRAKKGLTIEDASQDMNCTVSTYSKKENSPLSTPIVDILTMASNLNGNFDELFNALELDFKSYCKENLEK